MDDKLKSLVSIRPTPRTEVVKLTAECMGGVEWTVRGMTGEEATQSRAENDRRELIRAVAAQSKAVSMPAPVVTAIEDMAGDADLTPEYIRGLYVVRVATVDPVGLTEEYVKKLANIAPTDFLNLANTVLKLTGIGAVDKKKVKSCSETQE